MEFNRKHVSKELNVKWKTEKIKIEIKTSIDWPGFKAEKN